tara:strand:+ start:263 stop:1009 length:747 start_codon:yes stop_codon:yes gene_type:complete
MNLKIFLVFLILLLIIFKNIKNKEHMNKIKKLEFVHIPKNAGTSIENLGKKFNINWGRFLSKSDYPLSDTPCDYYHWHSPYFIRNPKYKYFAILRNPYDKIISEFYYHGGKNKNEEKSDIENFYIWLDDKYNIFKKNKYWNNCHILPQHEFIYNESRNRKVDHLIYMNKDFITNLDKLFKKYDLGIDKAEFKKDNSRKKTFSKLDLNEKAFKQINEMYDKDFEKFNFTKLQYGVENFINENDLDFYEN